MRKDVAFLKSQDLMDYSMLVGIETFEQGARMSTLQMHQIGLKQSVLSMGSSQTTDVGELMSRRHCFRNGNRIYHLSIIDFFQKWDKYKKDERFTKTMILQKDPEMLSAIEPDKYARRFLNFMESKVFI